MADKRSGNKRIWVVLATLLVGGGLWYWFGRGDSAAVETPVFEVKRGPLTIAITSSGSVQSRDKVVITSELEGQNTVIWVIDEGVNVQAGDLLLEFDSSHLVEKRNEQEIVVANTEANLIIAQEKLGITEGDCEAALLDREVDQMLAKMNLEKYLEGDFPQEKRQYLADIALAGEEVKRATERLEWSEKLADAGFLTRTELQADELALQRKQLDLEMAQTRISVLTNYTVMQRRATLESDLRRTERSRIRTSWQNKSTLRQVESELMARTRERDRATNRLAELNFQIEKSKIYAPTNGIILYTSTVLISRRRWGVNPLEVGATAVERQELIYIPLESGMVVEVMVPEASLNKIENGMPANIKVDAFPGRVFPGKLVKIGILPDGRSTLLNPDLKLYKCEIEAEFQDVTIRPGMSCEVELVKETHADVLFTPVQCVVRVDGRPRVYAREGHEWVARNVRVGLDNNRMIHILEGLRVGDQVMLAPPVQEREKEKKPASREQAPGRERSRQRPAGASANGGPG